jgi:hypothetical protein
LAPRAARGCSCSPRGLAVETERAAGLVEFGHEGSARVSSGALRGTGAALDDRHDDRANLWNFRR